MTGGDLWGTVVHMKEPGVIYLLTRATLVGILLLKAGNTEVASVFWNEGLGSYRLLAAVAQEAGFMPAVPLVFHFAGTWRGGQEQLTRASIWHGPFFCRDVMQLF